MGGEAAKVRCDSYFFGGGACVRRTVRKKFFGARVFPDREKRPRWVFDAPLGMAFAKIPISLLRFRMARLFRTLEKEREARGGGRYRETLETGPLFVGLPLPLGVEPRTNQTRNPIFQIIQRFGSILAARSNIQ